MGGACRGGVVAVGTATLICAGRGRRSVIRRVGPLTKDEHHGSGPNAGGGRARGGGRGWSGGGRGARRAPGRGGHQLVISAQTKPASSRAIAVTATPAGLPRAVMVL